MNKRPFLSVPSYYEQFRPDYPDALIDRLIKEARLRPQDTVIDLGSGNGFLAFAFMLRGYNVTAVEPEGEMLRVAQSKPGAKKISWAGTTAEQFEYPLNIPLVVMGRSFHWMKRNEVLEKLYTVLKPGGITAIIFDPTKKKPENDWLKKGAYETALKWSDYRIDCQRDDWEPHETIIERSSFRTYEKIEIDETRDWQIEDVIGLYLSLSWCNETVLGDKLEVFKEDMRTTLLNYNPAGTFREYVSVEALILRKEDSS